MVVYLPSRTPKFLNIYLITKKLNYGKKINYIIIFSGIATPQPENGSQS